ncbi:hypothetical protein DUNSADRAFT_1821 [Dunaliella salina]|uniref:Encoded protein n=1 Tax=Dunaliella salina TaxID=3046 RepID=A0ABQ7FX07_DUNSA|nr:hypothetical protein DUNSADRAFT_1821 [Dunaliella salina]KAF5826889.1 hypothetical protein DUNSADRAFT_1821 [Dunaliella salina]|eukprot:KAF5826888.1 hypothetical protein DUNSADRAFT_1821 [Dunaliella salina]
MSRRGEGDVWTAEQLVRDIRKVKPDAYLPRRDGTEEEGMEGEEEEGYTPVLDLLGYAIFHGLINLEDQEDLEKALRTATNAVGAFYTVPCWMSSVTPPPLA